MEGPCQELIMHPIVRTAPLLLRPLVAVSGSYSSPPTGQRYITTRSLLSLTEGPRKRGAAGSEQGEHFGL